MNGYIKLHRKLLEWEWYTDAKVSRVFIHLLLLANFKDTSWRGQVIKRGQLVTSYPSLSKQLKFSVQELRTVFKKLKRTNEINTIATGKNLLVTLVNFDLYQCDEREQQHDNNRESTGNQHDSNMVSTRNQQQRNNDKKEKKDNNEKNKYIKPFLEIIKFYQETTGQNVRIGKTDSLIQRSDKFKKIIPRLKDGATVEECKAVIELKTKQWKGDKVMEGSLCIPTLFRASNFEKYLDECDNSTQVQSNNYTPPYHVPQFQNEDHKHQFFFTRYVAYTFTGKVDEYKVNTEYRQRVKFDRQADLVCYELEKQHPEFALMDVQQAKR